MQLVNRNEEVIINHGELLKLQKENKRLKNINDFLFKVIQVGIPTSFIFFYLILPSPISLLFPQPIQKTLKAISCTTQEVYKITGIE